MPISMPQIYADRYNDPEHFKHVLEYLFTPALAAAGYEAVPPSVIGSGVIHAEIIQNLETCDMVLCDISTLNANVFFELGIRTSLDRPVILVRDEFTTQIPFDTGSINTYMYNASLQPWTLSADMEALTLHIQTTASKSDGRNGLWRYFGLTQRAAPAEISDPIQAKLDLLIGEVTRLTKNSEPAFSGPIPSELSVRALRYEYQVSESIRNMGYAIRNSGMMYGGFDLIIEGADHRIVVAELKYHQKPIGRPVIDTIISRSARTQVPVCLITYSALTNAAQEAVNSLGRLEVVEWHNSDDDDRLSEALSRMFMSIRDDPRTNS
jgi:hypothetical protein